MARKKKEEVVDSRISISEFIKENFSGTVAFITLLGAILLGILRFVEYLKADSYFLYYGLDLNLYEYYDLNLLFGLCLNILFLCAGISLIYCFKQISDNVRNGNYIKENIINFIIILISNVYLCYSSSIGLKNWISVVFIVVMIIFEGVFAYFVLKENKEQTDVKKDFFNLLKIFPFMIIIISFLLYIGECMAVMLKTEYMVINQEKVIVYTASDYYLILDCEIDEKESKLIIYKGTQEKINNLNVRSDLKKFNSVEVKMKEE